MNRILITGGTGLLGSNLALQLRTNNEVYILSNKKKIHLPKTKTNTPKQSVEHIFSSFKPNLVINAAAVTDIEFCENNPKYAVNTHVKFLETIISNCIKYNCKLIHISTDHLSNGTKPMIKEEVDLMPLNHYAKTKLMSEQLIQKEITNYLIIRTNFFGWGPKYRPSFSDRIIINLSENKEIHLFKDAFFSPVSIYNLVSVILKLYQSNVSGVFNVSSNDRISKLDFGILLSKSFKLNQNLIIPSSINNQKHLTIRPKDTSLDNTKVSKYLNYNCGTVSENIKHLFIDIKNGLKDEIMRL